MLVVLKLVLCVTTWITKSSRMEAASVRAQFLCMILLMKVSYHVCDHRPFPHKNTSNLKEHLKRKHPREYQEKDTQACTASTKQHTTTKGKGHKRLPTAPRVVQYSKDGPQYIVTLLSVK